MVINTFRESSAIYHHMTWIYVGWRAKVVLIALSSSCYQQNVTLWLAASYLVFDIFRCKKTLRAAADDLNQYNCRPCCSSICSIGWATNIEGNVDCAVNQWKTFKLLFPVNYEIRWVVKQGGKYIPAPTSPRRYLRKSFLISTTDKIKIVCVCANI